MKKVLVALYIISIICGVTAIILITNSFYKGEGKFSFVSIMTAAVSGIGAITKFVEYIINRKKTKNGISINNTNTKIKTQINNSPMYKPKFK